MTRYDGIIIGGGPGGYEAALYALRLGKKVAIVEKDRLGGVCLHWGCIPTKTLIASAKSYSIIKNSDKYGLRKTECCGVDWNGIHQHHRKVVNDLTSGLEKLLRNKGIDVHYGYGSLVDAHSVKVEPEKGSSYEISADMLFIATGSKPIPVPETRWEDDLLIPGEDCFKWSKLPSSVLIVGGGVMGVEFACTLRVFDVEVHVVEILEQLLPGEDVDVSRTLARELKKDGAHLHIGRKIEGYRCEKGKMIVNISDGEMLTVDKILICAGRTGLTENLGLEKPGIEINGQGYIKTNSHNLTNIDNIYAFGDVTGPPLLAHAASYKGKIAISHAFTGQGENNLSAIPSGIFTMPEIGRVGLTEQKCDDMGIKYRTGMAQMRMVGRAHVEVETTGFAKIIIDEKNRIIGAHVMGKEAGEIIHSLALAVSIGMTSYELEEKLIFAHPTLTEVIWEALKELNNPL